MTMDTWPGSIFEPASLHKYLYCEGNPVNGWDPSGNIFRLSLETALTIGIAFMITAILYGTCSCLLSWLGDVTETTKWEGWIDIETFGILGSYGCFSARFDGTHKHVEPKRGTGFYFVLVFGVGWGLPYNFSTAQGVKLESPGLWGANPGVLRGPVYWLSTSFSINKNNYKDGHPQ